MFNYFFPDDAFDKFEDITPEYLKEKGIKALLLDIDNTLVPYSTRVPEDKTLKWLKLMRDNDIKICILSNAKEERIRVFTENLSKYDIGYISKARKPWKSGFERALELLELNRDEVAMVGDQIYTDIWGGNRSGIYTILVRPIDKNENIFIKFKRVLELPVLYCYKNKQGR